jgi:heme/copper-type cytochrome/quinol oxidase subunit 2
MRRSLSATTLFALAPTSAHSIFELSLFALSATAAIFVFFALLAYSIVKMRQQDDRREPRHVYESKQAGLAWTLIPLLIIVALFWQQRE